MATIEIFSANCPCCDMAVQTIRGAGFSNATIVVRDMKDPAVAADAKRHGIKRVPAVVVDGKLAGCCATGAVKLDVLRGMGVT
jgi:glutaredoxin